MSTCLKPGDRLMSGEIEIIDLVGSGSIGEVYRAARTFGGERQLVAVKCLRVRKLESFELEAIAMVRRASIAISRIHHPSIVPILNVELDSSFPFIIEEYLAGGNLSQALSARKMAQKPGEPIFSPMEICSLGLQICAGLILLHQENHFHGDLKPSNLCFRQADQKEIVIVDFGHGGFLEGSLLNRNENMANLAYVPPERTGFVKIASNASSDLYSLGVILYECALGAPPFEGQDSGTLINRLLYEVPTPLQEVFAGFPVSLGDMISKLLRKNPNDRYHSAEGLAADIERCLHALREGGGGGGFALGTKDSLRELNYCIPMMGRDQELAQLLHMFERVCSQDSAVALIGAPSGTGKSRLAYELLLKARQKRFFISHVKFSEHERNLPLSAMMLLLVEHSHYIRSRTATDLQKWQQKVLERLGSRGRLIAERFPFYEGLLPVYSTASTRHFELDSQVFNETLAEFLDLFAASGENQLILVDDLQWADWQSLKVLGVLADRIWTQRSRGGMLLGTYRSNEVDQDHPLSNALLTNAPDSSLIRLGPLCRSDADQLVAALLEEEGPEVVQLQDLTYRLTAGNPFYIYEYLKSAIHNGIFALDKATRTWHFHRERIPHAHLSSGVAGLVTDRIRNLETIEQVLTGIASIAGQGMDRRALSQLLPLLLKMRGLDQSLPDLQSQNQKIELAYQGLLQRNLLVSDTRYFRFFHDKIQEASYSMLSDPEKATLHPAYGLWCAEDQSNHQDQANESLKLEAAYHLCKGDRTVLSAFARGFLIDAAKSAHKVFAYDKAKDYLKAVVEALDAQPGTAWEERFEALALLADTLSISEQIAEAMKLYDTLLEFPCTPFQRATIYCKKCEFALNLFDYKQARDASAAGLEALGAKIMTGWISSCLTVLFLLPILIIYAYYFKYFGRQTQEITDDTVKLRFQLVLKNEISQYFILPVAAIANAIFLTFELLRYKDCDPRAILLNYWGIASSTFGFQKLGNMLFAKAFQHFDRTGNPIEKGFVLFSWGLVCDMPAGNLSGAHKKMDEAVRILAPIGESFWQSISLVGLVLIDSFGGETGQTDLRAHQLIELWKKVGFAATPLGTTLRPFLELERDDQVASILEITTQAEAKIRSQGFETIDRIFALISLGEYYELTGAHAKATDLLRQATWMGVLRLHRMAYATYAPVAYARSLIHQRRLLRALTPLALSWLNQTLNARLYLPQTLFTTGYWLDSIGLKRIGQLTIEAGIAYASRRHWAAVVAEGRLLLGGLIMHRKPDIAMVYLQLAKEYFQLRNWKFHMHLCEKQLNTQNLVQRNIQAGGSVFQRQTTLSNRLGMGIRQQIEIQSLLQVLLKLSAISDREALFQAIMEALCKATGSELALLIFRNGERWVPQVGHNVVLQSGDLFSSRVDRCFMDSSIQAQIREPLIRHAEKLASERLATRGSAMMVPLVYEARIYGYCYLANTQIYELFDEQSIEIAAPIATQGAIAFHNINLNAELASERDQLARLHQTLEQRVADQTRDIKSILQHIKMGICTVSGQDASINKDYSLFMEKLLRETDLNEKALLPLLLDSSDLSAEEKDQAKSTLVASLNESETAFYINEHILPRSILGADSGGVPYALELDWIPISNDSHTVEKILVTINDVTALRGLEQQAFQKDQELRIISEILGCSPREWLIFINSSQHLLKQNESYLEELAADHPTPTILRKMFINFHTIKGNARTLGCRFMSETIHGIEQYFSQITRQPEKDVVWSRIREDLATVAATVDMYQRIAEDKLGRSSQGKQNVLIEREQLSSIYGILKSVESQSPRPLQATSQALGALRNVLFHSVQSTFQLIFSGIETLALDLGKANPKVHLDLPLIWVTEQSDEILRNSFVHLVRNAMDHGIEAPDERLSQGKAAEGTINLSAQLRGSSLEIRLQDDGRGLNLDRLIGIGLERGLISEMQAQDPELVAPLIFLDNLSTSERASEISGRGVGLTAVAEYIQCSGGSIAIELLDHSRAAPGFRPFAYIINLPLELFQIDSQPYRSSGVG